MKKRHKFLALLMAAALLAATAGLLSGSASAADPQYWYGLYVTDYKAVESKEGVVTLTMELYAYNTNDVKGAVSGCFGLRFPTLLDVKFQPGETVELLTPEPGAPPTRIEAAGQDFFIWNLKPGNSGSTPSGEIPGKTVTVFGNDRQTQGVPGGIRLHIGTYTAEIAEFPAQSSIGVLDWYATGLSKDPAYTAQSGASGSIMNDEIWNDSDGDGSFSYQCYHMVSDTDPTMVQTDCALKFTAPDYWPNAFTVLSYDPKKPISVSLAEENGNAVENTGFTVPKWKTGVTTADSGSLYAVGEANKNTGTGAYYAAVEMTSGPVLENGKAYKLTISKPGHLTVSLSLTGAGGDITQAEGFPKEAVYLPAGDIDPVGSTEASFGNGRIDMADRAALMRFMSYRPAVPAAGETGHEAAWLADIDGDGRVTQADLSILMSPVNYAKQTG